MRAGLCLLLLLVLVPWLGAFRPFSQMDSVCPECPPWADVMQFVSQEQLVANIVAHNRDYFVVERFSEYRAVRRDQVAAIAWKDNQQRQLDVGDQIILKNGVTLHGKIVTEKPSGLFVILVEGRQHIAWTEQIEAVYKNGDPHPIGAAPSVQRSAPPSVPQK